MSVWNGTDGNSLQVQECRTEGGVEPLFFVGEFVATSTDKDRQKKSAEHCNSHHIRYHNCIQLGGVHEETIGVLHQEKQFGIATKISSSLDFRRFIATVTTRVALIRRRVSTVSSSRAPTTSSVPASTAPSTAPTLPTTSTSTPSTAAITRELCSLGVLLVGLLDGKLSLERGPGSPELDFLVTWKGKDLVRLDPD